MDLQEIAEKIPDLEISNLQSQLNRENSDLICGEASMEVDGNNEVHGSGDERRTTTLLVSTAVFGIFLATAIGVNSYKYKATTTTTISRDHEEAPTMHKGKGNFRWVTEGLGELPFALDSGIEGEEERGAGSAVMMREWPPPKPLDHEVADTAEEETSAETDGAGTVTLSELPELLSMDKEGFMLVKPCEVAGIARKKKESSAATLAMRGTDKAPTVTLENPWRCGDRQVLGPKAGGDWALRGVVDFPHLLCMLLDGEVSAEVRNAVIEEIAGERAWKGAWMRGVLSRLVPHMRPWTLVARELPAEAWARCGWQDPWSELEDGVFARAVVGGAVGKLNEWVRPSSTGQAMVVDAFVKVIALSLVKGFKTGQQKVLRRR